MISRPEILARIQRDLKATPAVALLGPRQCGKTTRARGVVGHGGTYFGLENPVDLARLETLLPALEGLRGPAVIDEVPRRPELFPVLRVLLDAGPVDAHKPAVSRIRRLSRHP